MKPTRKVIRGYTVGNLLMNTNCVSQHTRHMNKNSPINCRNSGNEAKQNNTELLKVQLYFAK